MLKNYLNEDLIELKIKVKDWKDAIEKGGTLLEKKKLVLNSYTKAMIKSVEEIGPYIVIMPGVALAHSRPGNDVLKDCISLITLETPINFGNSTNNPVEIIFSIGATSNNNHIEILKTLVEILNSEDKVEIIKKSKIKKDLFEKIIK